MSVPPLKIAVPVAALVVWNAYRRANPDAPFFEWSDNYDVAKYNNFKSDAINGLSTRAYEAEKTRRANGGANAPSRGETGQVIKDSVEQFGKDAYAQTNRMYDEVGELAGNTPVTGAAVKEHLAKISTRFDKAGTSEKLNLGKTYEGVLGQTRAIVDDINKGASFTTVKEARTSINALARDAGTPAEKRMYEELSSALNRANGFRWKQCVVVSVASLTSGSKLRLCSLRTGSICRISSALL